MLSWIAKHRALLAVVTAALLAAAWRWTPLGDWLRIDHLTAWAHTLEAYRLTGLLVVSGYVLASILMVPVNLLVLVTSLAFEPIRASVYAFGGSLAAATVTFFIGRVVGQKKLGSVSSSLVESLNEKLDEHGILAIATVRLLPLAPFGVVNMAAGTTDMRARDFVLGSAIGMAPGIAAIVILEDRLQRVLQSPSTANVALLVVLALAVIAAIVFVQRKLRSKSSGAGA